MVPGEQLNAPLNVAVAAVTCGRLTQADVVHAARGPYTARADQYGVNVTETDWASPGPGRRGREAAGKHELVLEHWGGDAEMLAFASTLRGATRRLDVIGRARVAARTVRDHDLDSLLVTYPNGAELTADRVAVVVRGPSRGPLRRRRLLVRAELGELL
jgi:hypothetical protein